MEFIKLEHKNVDCINVLEGSVGVLVNRGSYYMFRPNSTLISASESLAIANELSRLNNQTQWEKQSGNS